MAVNVLAYFAERENSVISRSTARGQASGRGARGCGRGAGGGSRNAGLVRAPRVRFWGVPSPQHLAPDAAPLHDVLETKGVRCLASECLNALCPSNKES
jgi:hypothetical protein